MLGVKIFNREEPMRKIATAITLVLMASTALAAGSHSRKAHIRKDGTYVAPSHATNPDRTRSNNYSHKGNVNTYTGKKGTKQ
jgi:hypothetical protein